jgi:phage terminase large subunit
MIRVDTVRRVFPRVWMDTRCEDNGGLGRLAAYREKLDERLNIGLGPLHDEASHGADAFGLLAVYAEQNGPGLRVSSASFATVPFGGADSWMGA